MGRLLAALLLLHLVGCAREDACQEIHRLKVSIYVLRERPDDIETLCSGLSYENRDNCMKSEADTRNLRNKVNNELVRDNLARISALQQNNPACP